MGNAPYFWFVGYPEVIQIGTCGSVPKSLRAKSACRIHQIGNEKEASRILSPAWPTCRSRSGMLPIRAEVVIDNSFVVRSIFSAAKRPLLDNFRIADHSSGIAESALRRD